MSSNSPRDLKIVSNLSSDAHLDYDDGHREDNARSSKGDSLDGKPLHSPSDQAHRKAAQLEWMQVGGVLDSFQLMQQANLLVDQHMAVRAPLTCVAFALSTSSPERPSLHDRATHELAQFLRRASRATDTVGYYRSDVLAVLLSEQHSKGAVTATHRFSQEWTHHGEQNDVCQGEMQLKAGIAEISAGIQSARELLAAACVALDTSRTQNRLLAVYSRLHERDSTERWEKSSSRVRERFPRLVDHLAITQVASAMKYMENRWQLDSEHLDTARAVANSALTVADRLHLSPTSRAQLASAALVRDIGMTLIPKPILARRGPLDKDGLHFLHRHPRSSVRSVERLLDADTRAIVFHHHERMDGQGYPEGLGGQDVPLGARILSVCDAYVAMRSDRVHRPALSDHAAREQLRAGKGAHFDPEIVETFLQM